METKKIWIVSVLVSLLSLTFLINPVFAASPVITWEYDQIKPKITFNSKVGEYLIVWEDHHWGWGADWDIYGRRIGSNGGAIGTQFGISWDSSNHRLAPAVAANTSSGDYLVVWEYEYSADDHDIYARRVASDGSLIGNEFAIATKVNYESSPAVVYNPYYNEYLVVWVQVKGSDEFTEGDIYARRINADGTTNGNAFVVTNQSYDERAPAVAYSSTSQEYLVVWESKPSAANGYDITGQRLMNNGTFTGSKIYISSWTYDQRKPQLAYNSRENQFLVVWEDYHPGAGTNPDIYGQRIGTGGSLLGTNFPISWDGNKWRQNPSVAYSKAGNEYLVVWEYVYSATDHDIYKRRVKKDGTLIDTETAVSSLTSNEGSPAVASNGDLNYLAVWEDSRNAGSTGIDLYSELITLTAFSGFVYAGNVGIETIPLGGVTVRLYCSSNSTDLGTLVTDNTTNASGYYALAVSGTCAYYNILQVDLAGYSSAGATSVDGVVADFNRIRYASPLAGKTLSQNKFWDFPPSATTSCSSCSDCTAKLNGPYGTINLASNISTVDSGCIEFHASNVTLDCQGHSITGSFGEFTSGIKMVGKSNNTVKNCTISSFEVGIELTYSNNNNLNNNTLNSNGSGIYLANSDGNTLSSNSLGQNGTGIGINGSNANIITSNTMCKQTKSDIYGWNATTGNIQTNNKCDSIYNWNGNNSISTCATVCTPNIPTTCFSQSTCQSSINGDYNYITLTGNITGSTGITVNGNHLTLDCGGHTISGTGSSAGIVLENNIGVEIKNCTISNFGNGVELKSASLNTLRNNQITANNIGVLLSKPNSAFPPTGNTIATNSINNNSSYGISLNDGQTNTISSNNISNNTLYALWITGTCNNTITNNTGGNGKTILYWHDLPVGGSIPTGNYGQVIFCNVHHSSIGNLTLNNGTAENDGILVVNSSTSDILENTITNTNGINLINSDHIRIYNNNITSNRTDAVTLSQCKNAEIYDNTIRDNTGGSGINNQTGSNYTLISNNTLTKNKIGVSVSLSSQVSLDSNSVLENTEDGVTISDSDYCNLKGNNIRENLLGLYFDAHSDSNTLENNLICYNKNKDIYNSGLNNTGKSNTCINSWAWNDTNSTGGCSKKCIGWYQYNYGYSFKNPSKDALSFGCPWGTCQGDYVDTFGEYQIYSTIDICVGLPVCVPFFGCYCLGWEKTVSTGIPDPHATVFYFAAYRWAGGPGECTGMSNTSLRFFYKDKFPSQFNSSAQKASDLTYTGNLEDNIDASHGAIMSTEIIEPYFTWYFFHKAGGNNANGVLNQVNQDIQNGKLGSIVMSNFSEAHTVVASDVQDLGNTARIYIYDSNIPGYSTKYDPDENNYPYITIDKVANTWSYTAHPEFFSIWYLPYSTSNGKFSLPLSYKNDLIMSWGMADTQVEDETGKKLGWKTGEFKEEIPLGAAFPNFGANGGIKPQGYVVPPNNYKVHMTGREAGTYNLALMFKNATFLLEDVPTSLNSADLLTYTRPKTDLPLGVFKLETMDSRKTYSVTLTARFSISNTYRIYSIKNASLVKGGKAIFRISPDFKSLIFTNKSPEPVIFSVEFKNSMISGSTPIGTDYPKASRSNITINPNTTLILTPGDWLNLSQTSILITEEICGNQVCGNGEDVNNCSEDCPALNLKTPTDNMPVNETTTLKTGTYSINDGQGDGVLKIEKDGITLDCNGAQIKGNGTGVGISSKGKTGVTIKNCHIDHFGVGIQLDSNTHVNLVNSLITANTTAGIQVTGSTNTGISQSYITGNTNGVEVTGSIETKLFQNDICDNSNLDITSSASSNNTGAGNICKNVSDWVEYGLLGCTYICGEFKNILNLPLIFKE